ncbi:unnamed protein product [Parnassius apollo]|uniref:Fatty acyl-CoA reductase n=1 Tax=Parnassius apollo TaxID=110799 RepID=A0A8S3W9T9_PARAO|nr:unnamed protein product [Parnassius apollo]
MSQPDITQKLTERIDDLKQRIAAWGKRIRRYAERSTQFNQNRLFQSDQKRLYESLERPMVSETGPAPNQADNVAFWRGLWSEPVNHNEGPWREIVASQCASTTPMDPVIITPDDVAQAVRRAPNWKSPGLDGLHHYWLKGACTLSKMYVLIRSKKDKRPNERLVEVLKDPLFDELRKEKPNFADKISIIQGDISEIRLGMSDEDWNTVSNQVHVIFHIAANVRFDVQIKTALLMNARGTREALRLGTDCKNLRSFVYVSTAYTHATRDRIGMVVPEQFYESPAPPDAMIQMAETMSDEKLDAMTPALIGKWPNTYSFSKAVSEEIVRTMAVNLPVCVIRPAIVISTYRDPIPGWLDISSAYGPSGIIIGVALGITHITYGDENIKLDIVPADMVNNATIVAAYETARRQDTKTTKIYTVTSSRNPILFGKMADILLNVGEKIATTKAIWYSYTKEIKYKYVYILLTWLLHFIPAYILDGVCLLIGKPRMFVNIYKKVEKLSLALGFFTTHDWIFKDDNLRDLYQSISPVDQKIFNFDIMSVDWEEKLSFWAAGVVKYLLKDDLKNKDKALRKKSMFRILHYIVSVLYLYVLWKLFKFCIDMLLHLLM